MGNDKFYMGKGTTAIGGPVDKTPGMSDNDEFYINIESGVSDYLIINFEAGDKLFINGTQHKGSVKHETPGQGPNGTNTLITYTSGNGGAANPFATQHYANQDPTGSDFWTEELLLNRQGGEHTATLKLTHHVGGAVASTTNIHMTSFQVGNGGMDFNDVHSQYVEDMTIGSMFQYGIPESMYVF